MAFEFIPILLSAIVALVVLFLSYEKTVEKTSFGAKHNNFLASLLIVLGIFMIFTLSFLKIVVQLIPYIILIFVGFVGLIFLFSSLGMNTKMLSSWITSLFKNVYWIIFLGIIVVWSFSLVWGDALLEQGLENNLDDLSARESLAHAKELKGASLFQESLVTLGLGLVFVSFMMYYVVIKK